MNRLRLLLSLTAFVLLGGLLLGDDPKKPTDTKPDVAPKTNHTLPADWKKLGLSDEQKKKVYAIEDEYGPKIAALQKQIEDLKKEENSKRYAVLTDEQKKHLKEIRDTKDSGGTKEDPKKDDSKKDDKKDDKQP
jgi:hypothetical protein